MDEIKTKKEITDFLEKWSNSKISGFPKSVEISKSYYPKEQVVELIWTIFSQDRLKTYSHSITKNYDLESICEAINRFEQEIPKIYQKHLFKINSQQ